MSKLSKCNGLYYTKRCYELMAIIVKSIFDGLCSQNCRLEILMDSRVFSLVFSYIIHIKSG
jgi:hypothetical protein